jgi:hypothetical protein
LWNMRVEFYKKGNPSPSNELVGKDPYKPVDYLDLVSQVKVERVLRMPFKRSQYYDWQSDFDKAQDPDQLRLVGENPGRDYLAYSHTPGVSGEAGRSFCNHRRSHPFPVA